MNSCGDKKRQKEDVSQNPTEIKAIKEILNAQKECWNNGDINGFMEGYWNSKELIFTSLSHEPVFGWENTLERYKNSYPTKESMGKLKFEFLDLKLISKNTASMKVKWELIRKSDNPNGLFWLDLRKFDKKWLITKDSTISFEINTPLSLLKCDKNNPA